MADSKHTPGPWEHKVAPNIIKAGHTFVCDANNVKGADVALIAAAPDLLAALEKLLATDRANGASKADGVWHGLAIDMAKDAIAKANGK